MENGTIKTTTVAFLDKDGAGCTEEGLDLVKGDIDELYPEEKGRPVAAIMGDIANSPEALAMMIRSGDCRYAVIRKDDKIRIMGPDFMADLADVLGEACEGETSWDIAIEGVDWEGVTK